MKVIKSKRQLPTAKFVARGNQADVFIYDDIGESFFGGISAKQFNDDLQALPDSVKTISLYINSAGGSVFEGMSIYNQLRRHPATVNTHIDGLAASISSLIAMVGEKITIAANGMMMIHKPMGGGIGTADDLRQVADALDKVQETLRDTYVAKTAIDASEVDKLLNAETWMTASEALVRGFVDEIEEARQMAAHVNIEQHGFKNVPDSLPSAIYTVKPQGDEQAPKRNEYKKTIEIQQAILDR